MKRSVWQVLLACTVLVGTVGGVSAQRQDVSVAYLRAALDSVPDRGSVSFVGEYSGREGLHQASGSYLRNKGFSRFTVRQPETGVEFKSVYCEQDSAVFDQLLAVSGTKRFAFQGHKGTGAAREDAIFVTSAQPVREPEPVVEDEGDWTYRVTIINEATSNQTVLVNVELGKPVNLMGSTLTIEKEKKEPDGIRILR